MDQNTLPILNRRLARAAAQPIWRRIAGHVVSYAIVGCALLCAALRIPGRWLRRSSAQDRPARFVLTGGFEASGWLAAHIAPIAGSRGCAHVWIVADRPFDEMPNVTYACPPRWLRGVIGSVAARTLWFALVAVRRRADIVGGFHLLCNGLAALAVGSLTGARTMYFSVGGWAEVLGGGAFSGTRFFGDTGVNDPRLEAALVRAIRRFDITAVMGTKAKRFFESKGVTRVEVLPGGIDRTAFAPASAANQDFDAIVVARLDGIKRHDVLLHAVRRAAGCLPSLSVAIVGDGPLKEDLVRLADTLGITANVHFAGFQAGVGTWLNRARIFVLTSDSEGLPLAAMEAMVIGLPVVASNVGDLEDLVESGVNGYLVAPRDVTAFGDRIVELLQDRARHERFARAAAASAARFGLDSARAQWDDLLAGMGFNRSQAAQTVATMAL